MAKEKNEISNSIWSIFSDRYVYKFFSLFPHRAKSFGFSLIEVLVVIAVIGVMAGSVMMLVNPVAQMQKARDSRTIANAKEIQTALELYRADCGKYPDGPLTADSTLSGVATDCNGTTAIYMKKIPAPGSGGSYTYTPDGSGGYTLFACLQYKDAKGEDVIDDTTNCTSTGKAVQVESP